MSVYFSFNYPSMTYENAAIPRQYYHLIDLYYKYGGDKKNVEPILKKYGLNEQDLKKDYERYMGRRDSQDGEGDGMTWEQFEDEIAKYCEIANEMASLSPEEYAKRTDDEKKIDSAIYTVIEIYLESGGKEENLQKYEQYQKLDKARAKRLSEMSDGI